MAKTNRIEITDEVMELAKEMIRQSQGADKSSKAEIAERDRVLNIVKDMFMHRKTLKDLKGITDDEMDAMYGAGYAYYINGKQDKAEPIFSLLCEYDQYETKYWLALGACRQMMKKYKEALECYEFAASLTITDPKPAFYAAECFLSLKDKAMAEKALISAITISKGEKEFKEINDRANVMLENLKKQKG